MRIAERDSLILEVVLIETLWNVNKDFYGYRRKTVAVLIETLWNVNVAVNCSDLPYSIVLIETLWNVNGILMYYLTLTSLRINRNIVECKSR